MPKTFRSCAMALALSSALAAGCTASRVPEEMTDDGLARVPSRSIAGVYRLPGASFTQYRRIMLEPPTISFTRDWEKNHREVAADDVHRIVTETATIFRDEFTRELIDEGSYEFTEELGADVLIVNPAIEDLDIPAPMIGAYTTAPVKMKVTGELRDAATGALVGRLTIYEGTDESPSYKLRQTTRASNAHEQRLAFAKWSRILNEALAVARVEQPR